MINALVIAKVRTATRQSGRLTRSNPALPAQGDQRPFPRSIRATVHPRRVVPAGAGK